MRIYENEGYFFSFHDAIESLSRLYLEKKLNYEIKERKVHRKYASSNSHTAFVEI